MKEEFVLPEKWCIRGCYNFNLWISKWDTENKENTINVSGLDNNLFYYNLDIKNTKSWDFSSIIREDYIEITLEEFKQYVLNKELVTETEIKQDYTYLIKILEKL